MQRGRVIDAVAEKADYMTTLLQRQNDSVLVIRRYSRKYAGALDQMSQSGIAHLVEFSAQHDPPGIDTDLRADVLRDELVVSGDDLHLHAISLECGDSIARAGQWRIEKRQETNQRHLMLVIYGDSFLHDARAVCDPQHAQALCTQPLIGQLAASSTLII